MKFLNHHLNYNPKFVPIVSYWIIFILLIVGFSTWKFSYKPTFPYANELLTNYGHRILTTWAQFDGVHYLTIIDKGYEGTGLIQAFFPLYPLLVKCLSLGVLNSIVVGIIISVLSMLGGLYFLHQLILMDEKSEIAKKSLFLLLLFPTAFFFISLYTESLFLLLVVTSFYAARRGKWWLAGTLGMLAGLTRLVGVFVFFGLLYEYWLQYGKKFSKSILFCFGPLAGLLLYMTYLWTAFGDPLLFYHVQDDFGANRSITQLVLLPQVFFRYAKMLVTTPLTNPIYLVLIQELFAGLLGLIGLIYAWIKIRRSYVLFAIGAYLLPTLTGTFSSMLRYLLPLFPLFIVLAKYLPKKAYILTMVIFTLTLIYNVIRFTMGLWVA